MTPASLPFSRRRIGGEPARPVIFKPGQPGMTIVWFEKIKN